ncbi:GPR endopeptidase, partial [Vibrio cholerae]|uniref:GPR endopeptidase n=1 Tax=Vibrio cholerae TaxID=666 RepID=UPI001C11F3F4
TEETIGIPVIAIGVPTVVDAATIVISALESIESDMLLLEQDNPVVQKTFHDLYNMYVTSKDIDETIKRL